jgi:hypothetical protein
MLHRDDKRRYRVTFRVTADERQRLDAAARRSGRSLSDHIRAVLIGTKPTGSTRPPSAKAVLLARTLAKLGVIAAALGDITTQARAAGVEVALLQPGTERELVRQLRALDPCRAEIMRALRRKARPT